MASRAPTAQPLVPATSRAGNLCSAENDIRKSDSDSILPVGFWAITDEDELALDRYEGYPRVYSKININGAMTYVMNSDIAPPHLLITLQFGRAMKILDSIQIAWFLP